MDAPEVKRDLDRGETRVRRVRGGLQGQARRHRGRPRRRPHARRGGPALRGDRRPARPARSPMRACSMPATPPIRRAPSSTATCRSASPRPRCTCCSSRSSSTASTTPCSRAAMADPALGHYRPWIEDIRKEKPYQLEDRVEQLFHEKSVTGYSAPGTGCSTRPWRRCASRSTARRWRSSRRSTCCRTPTRRSARPPPRRWPRPSRRTCASSR